MLCITSKLCLAVVVPGRDFCTCTEIKVHKLTTLSAKKKRKEISFFLLKFTLGIANYIMIAWIFSSETFMGNPVRNGLYEMTVFKNRMRKESHKNDNLQEAGTCSNFSLSTYCLLLLSLMKINLKFFYLHHTRLDHHEDYAFCLSFYVFGLCANVPLSFV